MYQDLSTRCDWPVRKDLVDLPVRMEGNSKCTSGNSLIRGYFATEAESRLRLRLPLVPRYDFSFGINENLLADNWINFFSSCRSLIRQSIFPWNRAATLVEPRPRLPHPVVTAISPILRALYQIG